MILDSIFDAEWKGKRGEKLTERELKLVKLFGRKGKILRNVYIPKDNGETTEIDIMFITQKGIFVFESKNYSGWIFGDEKGMYWTASLPNGQKNKFYNPIKQNRTHIKWLRKYVGESIPLFSIIVFSERCELKKVNVESGDVKVIKRDWTYATVRSIWEKREDTVEDVNALYEKLKILTKVDDAVKAAHVSAIERRYKQPKQEERSPVFQTNTNVWKPVNEPDISSKEETGMPELQEIDAREVWNTVVNETRMVDSVEAIQTLICPWCGKELILRTAMKGTNAGKQFYGCSGFPKCRYVKNMQKGL